VPGYQLELTVTYPPRPDADPVDYWRWLILDALRRSLVEVDFRDDNVVRCGGGFGDDWYAAYRDRFGDERRHLTYGTDDGGMRQMPIRHGVYGLCRVATDLRSARVRFVDDDRTASGTTHRGVRALAQAFVYELEYRERLDGSRSLGGERLDWPPVRSRVSLSENWFPGRDVLLISDEGDAFVKEGGCDAIVGLARTIVEDLERDEDGRAAGLRTLTDAVELATATSSVPPPAVLVLTEEIAAAELLVDQVRLRTRLPMREVDRCVDCGGETLRDRPIRAPHGTGVPADTASPMITPLWGTDGRRATVPGRGVDGVTAALPGAEQPGCRRCSSRHVTRRSVYLCPACARVLPDGWIRRCPRCRSEVGGQDAVLPYYWFSPPAWTDGRLREYQPGADPRDAVRR
jgi:hypothetical protein